MLLTSVRVVACETGLAGPLCTRLLADLGAEVVKVEQPGRGDVTRGWDTIAQGLSSGFVWVNRGKRSVALDVKDATARPALERLVAGTDVFLQNLTPGWAERVGLDERAVRALCPDVVYTEISGYGPDGPYAARNAYDLVMQGEAGLLSVTGTPEAPARIGVSVCDLATGAYAATATAAALVRRAETGEGAHVAVSLFDVMVDWLGYYPHLWWHRREMPERTGLRHPLFSPYGPYRAGDGRLFSVAVLSPEHWRAFCVDVLARPELADDPRFAANEGRVEERDELEARLEQVFSERTADEWIARLDAAGIPCGRVNDVAAVMDHPQLEHNALLAEVDSPVGPIPTVGSPFVVGGARPAAGSIPRLGGHTEEVLAEPLRKRR